MLTLDLKAPLLTAGAILLSLASPGGASPPLDYNRDIRPILSNNCFQCHGPDKSQRKGDLRLDVREEALRKKAFVPGKPDESQLVSRIFALGTEDSMPPPESKKSLTDSQKQSLKRWIAEGAKYAAHWAYVPVTRSQPPGTKRDAWVRNPIDSFVLARLESQGLEPSREADRRQLARRLSLDLIGLPPDPEGVAALAGDSSPRAYEKLVDQLLDSQHFGERMAVPWLDLVRFSDSVGYHGDQLQRIFPYRDYVIDAFNKNMPFDRFTIEQIAGDLIPEATDQSRVATGFNRLNMMTREGGAQPKEYLAKYASDRVRTVSVTWLGSTMGCCECHDHKYDPFTARDFYSLAAFFADLKQWGVYQDYNYTPNPDLKGWSNDHPFPPEIEVRSEPQLRRKARLEARIRETAEAAEAASSADLERKSWPASWREESLEFLKKNATGWRVPGLEDVAGCEIQPDGSVLLTGDAKAGGERKLALLLEPGWVASLRLEALPHEKNGGKILRGGGSNASIRISASLRRAGAVKDEPIAFAFADADAKEPSYFNGEAISGVLQGWRTPAASSRDPHAAIWLLDRPLRASAGDRLVVTIKSDNLGCARLSVSPFVLDFPGETRVGSALQDALEKSAGLTREQSQLLAAQRLLGTAWDASAFVTARADLLECLEIGDGKTFSMVSQSVEPYPTRVLKRGNWQDESGLVVEPAVPSFLPHPVPGGKRLTRLDLAHWLVTPENPLTARVFVNRLWKLFFGTGLSASVDDVGAQGEAPSHPELLDWLASEFVMSGWNVKHMVKLIVLSSTYRQDSSLRPELRDVDPGNRLLASQNPRRLEAEFVRDNALAIAGLLNFDVGGPSARPYQPAGYYANLQFPDREYVPQKDDRQYRRGVYVHWQRTFLHPMLANFDAPPREECTALRVVSNTPQQALTLLNDPSFVEASRAFAAMLLLQKAGSDEERLNLAYQRALARSSSPRERPSILELLRDQRGYYASHPDDARKLLSVGFAPAPPGVEPTEVAAWTQVCRVILNLHESITRY